MIVFASESIDVVVPFSAQLRINHAANIQQINGIAKQKDKKVVVFVFPFSIERHYCRMCDKDEVTLRQESN